MTIFWFPSCCSLLLCLLLQAGNSIECKISHECANQPNITEASTTHIACKGSFSCANVSTIQGNGNILCYGGHSCFNADKISELSTSSDYFLRCYGYYSCGNVKLIESTQNVKCEATLACTNSVINITNGARIFGFGERSCENTTVYCNHVFYMYAHFAARNATFISTDDSVTFDCQGRSSCTGATIICGTGHRCYLYCYGNSCEGLTLRCAEESPTSCNFQIDCTYSDKNDICPNGK